MILPTTHLATLLLLTLALIALGSWANFQKILAKNKWRFELYYFDFALGAALVLVAAAYTLGSMNSQDLTFQDNLLITGYRKMAYAVAAGLVFNIGNMLLVAAIAIAGMAVGFPIVFGVAAFLGVIFSYIANPHTNPILIFGGGVAYLAAAVLCAFAYSTVAEAVIAKTQKAIRPDPRAKAAPPAPIGAARAIVLSVLAGIIIGLARPLVEWAREGENGVSSYGIGALFGAGMLLSTLVAAPFFINFPAIGAPVNGKAYFRGTKMQHIMGVFSGILWGAGILAAWVSLSAPASVQAGPAVTYAFTEGATLLAALWGLVAWKDLGGPANSKTLGFGSVALFLIGIGLVFAAYSK
jgi:glucose uptake protein